MNKRALFILAIVVALALPTAAMAATEFSLGGFIKLEAFWDSTQERHGMGDTIVRNNSLGGTAGTLTRAGAGVTATAANANTLTDFQHGRLKFTSQATRINFVIKGPKLWGANTTGMIEMDFDNGEATGATASNSYTPRFRMGFFRMDWPETELLLGQYYTFVSQWFPELAQDGPFGMTASPTARSAQIRLTQRFAGAWQVAALVGEPNSISDGQTYSANDRGAESTETPQVMGQVQFAQDLYGKAAWYGKPTPFTAQINAGWQRGIVQDNTRTLFTTSQNNYAAVGGVATERTHHKYVNPWIVSGVLFIPIIPTHSANLAGTASLQTTWWVGEGVEAFGWGTFNGQMFRWTGMDATGANIFDVELMSRFGGQVQAQYYFTNQWFLTAAWGMSRAFNVRAFEAGGDVTTNNKSTAFQGDIATAHNELGLCLWYRPVTAFKFGLQYSYNRTDYAQSAGTVGALAEGAALTGGTKTSIGEAHRVTFVGLFFF